MTIKISIYCIISVILVSCNSATYHFDSPDKKQSITIITRGDVRYIINGHSYFVPDSNFVKVDLSGIDRETGDETVGCWDQGKFRWVIAMNGVRVLENKTDTSLYRFESNFPLDKLGIPTVGDFRKKNCFSIAMEYRNLSAVQGALLQ